MGWDIGREEKDKKREGRDIYEYGHNHTTRPPPTVNETNEYPTLTLSHSGGHDPGIVSIDYICSLLASSEVSVTQISV
jgi:hypothetical protein